MVENQLVTTQLLADIGKGDQKAAARLFPLVYDELRALAGRYFRRQNPGHTLQPTGLVHEAFLRLIDQTNAQWKDRAHFFAVAATAMRQILVNHALARNAQKRGGGRRKLALTNNWAVDEAPEFDAVELDEALRKLATLDERKAKVVELRFFGGLTVEEVAEVLGVSKATVEGDWRMARAWLSRALATEGPE